MVMCGTGNWNTDSSRDAALRLIWFGRTTISRVGRVTLKYIDGAGLYARTGCKTGAECILLAFTGLSGGVARPSVRSLTFDASRRVETVTYLCSNPEYQVHLEEVLLYP